MTNIEKLFNMKVSFDFDGTLTNDIYFRLASAFIEHRCDVHIVTARNINGKNDDLFQVAIKLGIAKEKIIFTNFDSKLPFVKDFYLHFDDDNVEIEDINFHGGRCLGILVETNHRYLF